MYLWGEEHSSYYVPRMWVYIPCTPLLRVQVKHHRPGSSLIVSSAYPSVTIPVSNSHSMLNPNHNPTPKIAQTLNITQTVNITLTLPQRWSDVTFGSHFSLSPLEGMVAPLTEAGMEVVFTPEGVDDDIRQEGVLCMIEVRKIKKIKYDNSKHTQSRHSGGRQKTPRCVRTV